MLFAGSCLIPVLLLYFWHDERYSLEPAFGNFWYPVGALFLGTIIYIMRAPEKCSHTGRFDIIGASHQIFHVAVLVAMGLCYTELINLYE